MFKQKNAKAIRTYKNPETTLPTYFLKQHLPLNLRIAASRGYKLLRSKSFVFCQKQFY